MNDVLFYATWYSTVHPVSPKKVEHRTPIVPRFTHEVEHVVGLTQRSRHIVRYRELRELRKQVDNRLQSFEHQLLKAGRVQSSKHECAQTGLRGALDRALCEAARRHEDTQLGGYVYVLKLADELVNHVHADWLRVVLALDRDSSRVSGRRCCDEDVYLPGAFIVL